MTGIRALGVATLLLAASAGLLRGQLPAAPDTATLPLARARALALAQVPDNEGVKSGRLETRDGQQVYEFEIETAGPGHQEVRVDAHTGAILSTRHVDDVVDEAASRVSGAARSTGEAAKHAGATVAGGAKQAGATVAHGAKAAGRTVAGAAHGAAAKVHSVVQGEDLRKAHPAVSEEQARAIAQTEVVDAPVAVAELDRDDGVLVWKIDLNTPGKGYEEVLVDATTGRVLSQEHKR
jgi:uncharacterized membrane protein YkoI